MFIDEATARPDLLDAIYGDLDLVDHFVQRDLDPEDMDTSDVLAEVREWIAANDECAAA